MLLQLMSSISAAVRDLLGITMEGDAAMQNLINIHFFSEVKSCWLLGLMTAAAPHIYCFLVLQPFSVA